FSRDWSSDVCSSDLPELPGTILEIVETQVRSSTPDPSPGRGGGAPPPLPPPGRGRGSPFRPSPLELRVWVGESPPPRPSTREAALPRPATRVGELRVNCGRGRSRREHASRSVRSRCPRLAAPTAAPLFTVT